MSIGGVTCSFVAGSLVLLGTTLFANAQEPATPTPSSAPASQRVRINFIPPPMEGTISLGIYDAQGKLVRVLHREAAVEDFEVGSDSLGATWDGRGDAEELLPPGKYHARGYVVGDLNIEGVGFFFNDWVIDEQSPRVKKITAITADADRLLVTTELASGETRTLLCDHTARLVGSQPDPASVSDCNHAANWPELVQALDCARGKEGTLWVIDKIEPALAEVKQLSGAGELLRQLRVPAVDPQPQRIASDAETDLIFLVEENASLQRLRALRLLASKNDQGKATSDWKVEFEKKIVAHKDFTIGDGKPMVAGGKAPSSKIAIKLQPNPLEEDRRRTIDLSVGYDAKSSFLQTADGLPLQTISETPHLTRTVLATSSETAVDIFQDDDTVVEQFRISGLEQMMAFDCGEIELK